MIEINLIPDVKREFLRAKSLRNRVVSASILIGLAVVGLAVVLGLIFAGQLVAESVQDRTIKTEGDKLVAIEDIDKVVSLQNQLGAISSQHSSKTIDSRLFDLIVAINPPAPNNAVISSIKLNPEDATIAIEGSAINGYIALEVFKKTVTSTLVQVVNEDGDVEVPLASDIVPGSVSFGENSEGLRVLRFGFMFTYPEELFARSEGAVYIVAPQGKRDMTDSKLGIPESLFGAKATDINDQSGGGGDE